MDEKDLSGIFVKEEIKEHVIKYKDQEFKFKVKELPWVTLNRIASRCIEYSGKKTIIDKSEYDVQFLETALVEAPWPLKQTRIVIGKINKEFGNLLRDAIIPAPFGEEKEELKNE
jgi:hypothetical protein